MGILASSHFFCLFFNAENTFKIIIYTNGVTHTLVVMLSVPTFKRATNFFISSILQEIFQLNLSFCRRNRQSVYELSNRHTVPPCFTVDVLALFLAHKDGNTL